MRSFWLPGEEWRGGATRIVKPHIDANYNEWCFQNCQGRFVVGLFNMEFELDVDAVLFKLRWTNG